MLKRVLPLVVGLVLLTVGLPSAGAHGYLVRMIPEDRAVLERSPTRLQYWFSEGLEPNPDFSTVRVRNQDGDMIATGGVDPENTALMTVRLPPNLPDGAYIVELRPAFASDGHVNAESRVFFVGEEVGGVSGAGATNAAIPLEVAWRAVAYAASVLLFGVFSLYTGVLLPAWASRNYPAGLLPPRLLNRLFALIGVGLVLAVLANIVGLFQQTAAFFPGVTFQQIIEQNLWSVVRIGSRFGDVWNARMVFLVVVGVLFAAALYSRSEQPGAVRAWLTASTWIVALVLGTFSIVSHAAGSLVLPWVGIIADWLHILGVGFWVGGLMVLVLVLPAALQPYQGEARRQALLPMLRRFSRVAAGAAVVVITTGIYSTTNWITTPADVTTPFGGALAFKLLLVALLMAVAAAHQIVLHPQRYQRFAALGGRVGGFSRSLRLETVFAVGVLAGAGWLTATPVPVPEFANQGVEAPTAAQVIDGYEVAVTVTPGGPGVNTYDVVVTRDGAPVEGLDVRLQQIAPNRDWRAPWSAAEPVEPGLYVAAGGEIDRPGAWWTLVDLSLPDGTTTRAAFDWRITNDAAVIESRPPGLANLLALAAVIAAVAFALYPSASRFYRSLELNPVNVTIAVGATVGTIGIMVVGLVFMQNAQQVYEETVSRPPTVVNAVLPDAASLERGGALYRESCAWSPDDLPALLQRLPRTRDDELYQITQEGWLELPGCGDLTESQRWDVVNYIRTLERR